VQPERLGSGEAVGAGRYATRSLAQEVHDQRRPGRRDDCGRGRVVPPPQRRSVCLARRCRAHGG
jgi:hypothetical protein